MMLFKPAGFLPVFSFDVGGIMSVTEQFKRLILEAGVSRYEMARRSNGCLTQNELSAFLAGRQRLGLRKLDTLAKVLGGIEIRRSATL